MLLFKKIRYKNILSFGNMMTEIQLDKSPAILVQGVNGGGKSAMLDAICFALFGKPFRKINKPHLVNHKNKKDLVVEIEFESNGVEYLVRRGLNPQIFEIYQSGVMIDQTAAVKDYQVYLERSILHFDYQIFTQIVILGKATFVSFLRLPAAERRKFIETILGISIFSVMNEVHKLKVNALKENMADLNTDLTILREKIALRKQYISDLETDAQTHRDSIILAIDTEIADNNFKISELGAKHKFLAGTRVPVDSDMQESLQTKLESLFDFRSRFALKLSQIETGLKFFETNLNCPTCSQPITIDLREEKKQSVDSKKTELEKMMSKVNDDITHISDKLNTLVESSNVNADIASKMDRIHDMMQSFNASNNELRERKDLDMPDRSKIDSAIAILASLMSSYEDELNVKADLVDTAEYYDLMSSMLKDNGIKSMIIKKYIPVINQTINKYLNKLGFFGKFVLDENFEEMIYSRGIDPLGYANFSEGEKLRIDLAVLLAWRDIAKIQNNTCTNLLIFDEILDASLDATGSDALLNILLNADKINLFIISHSPDKWMDKFRGGMMFGKVGGFSKLLT